MIWNTLFTRSHFSGKNDSILLKNSAYWKLQVLIELIFQYIFQFSIFILKQSSKWCPSFSLLFCSFWEISKSLLPRFIVKSYFIETFGSYRFTEQILFWSALIWVVPLLIFKWYCNAFRAWHSSITTHSNHSRKQGSKISEFFIFQVLIYEINKKLFIMC